MNDIEYPIGKILIITEGTAIDSCIIDVVRVIKEVSSNEYEAIGIANNWHPLKMKRELEGLHYIESLDYEVI